MMSEEVELFKDYCINEVYMKTIYRITLLVVFALSGCATNTMSAKQSNNEALMVEVNKVQKKVADCIIRVNQSDDAKYVDENIFALSEKSPNADALLHSKEKLTAEQAKILNRFRQSTVECRQIHNELPSPELVKVYTNFYENIDAVYRDLIDQRITIGVANQERQMRIRYARNRFAQILKAERGG